MLGSNQQVTEASDTQRCTLGATRTYLHPTYGLQKFVYVQNTSGSSLTAGQVGVCELSSGDVSTKWKAYKTAAKVNAHAVLGVAVGTLPDLYYGWLLYKGMTEVLIDTTNVTVGDAVITSDATAGSAEKGTLGTDDACFIGVYMETTSTDADSPIAFINVPSAVD